MHGMSEQRKWTEKEKDLLRKSYWKKGPKKLAEMLGIDRRKVSSMASYMGLRTGYRRGPEPRKRRDRESGGRAGWELLTGLTKSSHRIEAEVRETAPGLICWLKGGVNAGRAEQIKRDIERGR